jgi:hypothetical protein
VEEEGVSRQKVTHLEVKLVAKVGHKVTDKIDVRDGERGGSGRSEVRGADTGEVANISVKSAALDTPSTSMTRELCWNEIANF